MQDTPRGLRKHIVLIGRRNAGKSRLVNALSRQEVSIVSSRAGATTDPVEKTLELKPLGPVVLIDTAGVDDEGELGEKRVLRTLQILQRADLAILVTDGDRWGDAERQLQARLVAAGAPYVIARNKQELGLTEVERWRRGTGLGGDAPVVDVSAALGYGLDGLVASLASLAGLDEDRPLLGDLLPEGGQVLLVAPVDSGAPRGRLILPQAQAIRDCFDHGHICTVVTEKQLPLVLSRFTPDLLVCDSQVAGLVCRIVPAGTPLTTFSILMARFKGDLSAFARGARALASLKPGDAVLIQEACSHHAQKDDIGRVKIPNLLRKMAGGDLRLSFAQGKELAPYAADIKVIIHCGACVITGKQMERRQRMAAEHGIPMTNYGVAICCVQGLLPRALQLFPEALAAFENG